ncbi:MAG TPA: SDR family oxidoreductase [Clostridia bacterium]|nr:SDR family oxidoreductase [Clostridia bacterium]
MSYFRLDGERALILGAGGIGGAIAKAVAESGAEVVIADVSRQNLEQVEHEIHAIGGNVHIIETQITNRDDVVALYQKVQQVLPNITLSVNSIGLNAMNPAVEIQEEDWSRVIDGFLSNLFWSNQQAAKIMLPQKRGKIVNLASMSGVVVTGNRGSSYAAAKAGVIHLTRALASEWIGEGVYVNAISPGTVDTPLTAGFLQNPAIRQEISAQVPLGRVAVPADIVGPALFLLSQESNYVVGHNLIVDGGYTIR